MSPARPLRWQASRCAVLVALLLARVQGSVESVAKFVEAPNNSTSAAVNSTAEAAASEAINSALADQQQLPPPPSVLLSDDFARAQLRLLHPSHGAVVNVGPRVVVDVQLSFSHVNLPEYDGQLVPGFAVCLRVGSAGENASPPGPWACFDQFASLSMVAAAPGQQVMEAALVSKPPDVAAAELNAVTQGVHSLADLPLDGVREAGRPSLRESLGLVSFARNVFTAEDRMTCAGKLGEAGCGRPIQQHCTSPTRFRFFLYPSVTVPTAAAADVFYALRDSPMRTLAGDPAAGEACLYIAVGDVYAANVRKETPFEASKRFTRLPYWNGTGANHLIISFADYEVPFDTGRAMVAKSSFGKPIDRAFFRPHEPEALQQMQSERPGYDVVLPMAFYRCNMGLYTHLHKFDAWTPPAARFPAGHLASIITDGAESLVDTPPPLPGTEGLPAADKAVWTPRRMHGAGTSSSARWLMAAFKALEEGSNASATGYMGSSAAQMPIENRPFTLVFKGAVYRSYPGYLAEPRQTLWESLKGPGTPPSDDVVISMTCSAESVSCDDPPVKQMYTTHNDVRCEGWNAAAAAGPSFEDMLLRAKFAAVLPGEGSHSYRLYEALQAGAIPVIIGESALPLPRTLPWAQIAVIQRDTSPAGLRALLDALRNAAPSTLRHMQAMGRRAWLANLGWLPLQLHSTLMEVAAMYREAGEKLLARQAEDRKRIAIAARAANMTASAAASAPGVNPIVIPAAGAASPLQQHLPTSGDGSGFVAPAATAGSGARRLAGVLGADSAHHQQPQQHAAEATLTKPIVLTASRAAAAASASDTGSLPADGLIGPGIAAAQVVAAAELAAQQKAAPAAAAAAAADSGKATQRKRRRRRRSAASASSASAREEDQQLAGAPAIPEVGNDDMTLIMSSVDRVNKRLERQAEAEAARKAGQAWAAPDEEDAAWDEDDWTDEEAAARKERKMASVQANMIAQLLTSGTLPSGKPLPADQIPRLRATLALTPEGREVLAKLPPAPTPKLEPAALVTADAHAAAAAGSATASGIAASTGAAQVPITVNAGGAALPEGGSLAGMAGGMDIGAAMGAMGGMGAMGAMGAMGGMAGMGAMGAMGAMAGMGALGSSMLDGPIDMERVLNNPRFGPNAPPMSLDSPPLESMEDLLSLMMGFSGANMGAAPRAPAAEAAAPVVTADAAAAPAAGDASALSVAAAAVGKPKKRSWSPFKRPASDSRAPPPKLIATGIQLEPVTPAARASQSTGISSGSSSSSSSGSGTRHLQGAAALAGDWAHTAAARRLQERLLSVERSLAGFIGEVVRPAQARYDSDVEAAAAGVGMTPAAAAAALPRGSAIALALSNTYNGSVATYGPFAQQLTGPNATAMVAPHPPDDPSDIAAGVQADSLWQLRLQSLIVEGGPLQDAVAKLLQVLQGATRRMHRLMAEETVAAAADAADAAAQALAGGNQAPPAVPAAILASTPAERDALAAVTSPSARAEREAARRQLDTVIGSTLSLLSQLYSATGHLRAAATAAMAAALQLTFDDSGAAAAGGAPKAGQNQAVILRVRNANADFRRPVHLSSQVAQVATSLFALGPPPEGGPGIVASGFRDTPLPRAAGAPRGEARGNHMLLSRVTENLHDSEAAFASGYGQLAHFLPPAPLPRLHAPGAVLVPMSPCPGPNDPVDVLDEIGTHDKEHAAARGLGAAPAAQPATVEAPAVAADSGLQSRVVFQIASSGRVAAVSNGPGHVLDVLSAEVQAYQQAQEQAREQAQRHTPIAVGPAFTATASRTAAYAPLDAATAASTCSASLRHMESLLPYAGVSEASAHRVAASLRGKLPVRLPGVLSELLPAWRASQTPATGAPGAEVRGTPHHEPRADRDVAIVTLCAYNGSETALGRLSEANYEAYCKTHDIACYLSRTVEDKSRPTAWSKVVLLAKVLQRHAWVMWRDCDSFFMRSDVHPADILHAAFEARARVAEAFAADAAAAIGESSRVALTRALVTQMTGNTSGAGTSSQSLPFAGVGMSPVDVVASEDGFMLNTGVFFLRNSAWGRSLLRRAYGDLTPDAAPPQDLPLRRVSGSRRVAPPVADAGVASPPQSRSSPSDGLSLVCERGAAAVDAPFDIIQAASSEADACVWQADQKHGQGQGQGQGQGTWLQHSDGYHAAAAHATPPPTHSLSQRQQSDASLVVSSSSSSSGGGSSTRRRILEVPRVGERRLPAQASSVAGNRDAQAMLAARLPFNRNRAWEQATIFAALALNGGTADAPLTFTAATPAAIADAAAQDAAAAASAESAAAQDAEEAADGRGPISVGTARRLPSWQRDQATPAVQPAAFRDATRAQMVPQAWLNGYPAEIANKLHDQRLRPMHAPYLPGDWVVSFSGCGVLLSKERCEVLYAEYAAQAAAELAAAQAQKQ